MQNEPSQAMQVELYAASLRADYSDVGAFLEALAVKFEGALPAHTKVTRHASLFSREHPVKEIAVTLGEFQALSLCAWHRAELGANTGRAVD